MVDERSYGIIPLKKEGRGVLVFMVCHKSGHWTLPKGHPEEGETPLECAKRELFEETGLTLSSLLSDTPFVENYQFLRKQKVVDKRVEYFIGEVTGKVSLQSEEIQDGKWLTMDEALQIATYPQMKELLKNVQAFLCDVY
jgi:bis(5'-nucleosidyl)-tetraphosphatase